MPIEGPLKELDIHDVFQLLDLGRKTGELRITSDLRQNAGRVYFERGAVVAAVIQTNPHPLGGMLLRAGKILEADLARARAMQGNGDRRRLGDVLVEIGAIGRKELERQARAQVEEVVFELTSWAEGYFSFEEGPVDATVVEATVRIPTEALLMEAARRIDEWSRIQARIPHLGVVPQFAAVENGSAGTLDLVPFEWEVLAGVDGARDLRSLAGDLGRSEFDVARTVFGLASAGVIVLHDPMTNAVRPARTLDQGALLAHAETHLAVGDAESARLVADELIAGWPESAAAHELLGRALVAERDYDGAIDALQHALRLDPLLGRARRVLGLAQAALGRFHEAVESWERWGRLTSRTPEEETLVPRIRHLRDAARGLADALRDMRD